MGAKPSKEKNNAEGVEDDHENSESNVSESERRVNALLSAGASSREKGESPEKDEGRLKCILPFLILLHIYLCWIFTNVSKVYV